MPTLAPAADPDQLVLQNAKLPFFIAGKFRRWAAARAIDQDDVISVALEALLLGCRCWTPATGIPLSAWLGRRIELAIRKLATRKWCRWRHGQLPADAEGIEMDPPDQAEGPDAGQEANDDKALVERLLLDLPARERLAVELYHLADLPLRDVAERLHVTPKRAHQIASRAVKRLRAFAQAGAGEAVSAPGRASVPA